MEVVLPERSNRLAAASALQASGFRWDVTVFRVHARSRPKTGPEPAFRRNTAAPVYRSDAAHHPQVAGSNPAPATEKAPETGPFRFGSGERRRNFCPTFCHVGRGGGCLTARPDPSVLGYRDLATLVVAIERDGDRRRHAGQPMPRPR